MDLGHHTPHSTRRTHNLNRHNTGPSNAPSSQQVTHPESTDTPNESIAVWGEKLEHLRKHGSGGLGEADLRWENRLHDSTSRHDGSSIAATPQRGWARHKEAGGEASRVVWVVLRKHGTQGFTFPAWRIASDSCDGGEGAAQGS